MVAVDEFERVGAFREVMNWQRYTEFLTQEVQPLEDRRGSRVCPSCCSRPNYLRDHILTHALCVIAPLPTRVSVHTDGRAVDA